MGVQALEEPAEFGTAAATNGQGSQRVPLQTQGRGFVSSPPGSRNESSVPDTSVAH